jgi:hypothetical protein
VALGIGTPKGPDHAHRDVEVFEVGIVGELVDVVLETVMMSAEGT